MKKIFFNLWGKFSQKSNTIPNLTIFSISLLLASTLNAAPSHDPSTMIQNNDGRYWIFTTGDGVWGMSSNSTNFSSWQGENPVFPIGTWPSWIDNYVTDFNGFFWAPDVVKMNGKFYCYYSCAGSGAAAAIGVATANDLSGPWTDQGMVYAGNNAIDPSILIDDDGSVWMSWGNWVEGIDLVQINPNTGKRLNSAKYKLVDDTVEGPTLIKHGGYYYLYYQRGLCCNGVNSTYYNVVARSTSITGPYTDERVFLPNRSGNIIGPGHVGYAYGALTYHYYDGNNNGAANLMVTTLGYRDGWPIAGSTGDNLGYVNGTYAVLAAHSGKALDVYGFGTENGTNINQWSYWGGTAQQFIISQEEGEWHRITPVIATDKALDVDGVSTESGANINIWDYWGGWGQQFKFQSSGSGRWRIINRNSGLCLDVAGASTADGANINQWNCTANSTWQMFTLTSIKSAELEEEEIESPNTNDFLLYPNPSNGDVTLDLSAYDNDSDISVKISDMKGSVVLDHTYTAEKIDVNTKLAAGIYVVFVSQEGITTSQKLIIK